jgi:hypothetical protein
LRLGIGLIRHGQHNLQVAIKLQDWNEYTENLIKFNKMPPLEDKGNISNNKMKIIVKKDYKIFDGKRKQIEKEKAEKEAIEDLKEIEKEVKELLKKRRKKTLKEELSKEI